MLRVPNNPSALADRERLVSIDASLQISVLDAFAMEKGNGKKVAYEADKKGKGLKSRHTSPASTEQVLAAGLERLIGQARIYTHPLVILELLCENSCVHLP